MGFIYQHRIRYADTDQMGIAYHGRYFEWFEAARSEMIRSLGISYYEIELSGIIMPVIEVACRYRKPVKYDEIIDIEVTVGELTQARFRINYAILGENDTVRAQAHSMHCFLKDGVTIRIPDSLRELLKKAV